MDGNARSGWGLLLAFAFLLVVVLVVGAATLAACGDKGGASSTAPSNSSLNSPSSAPVAAALAAGEVATCPAGSTPDVPGPADQARPDLGVRDGVAMDRQSGRVVAFDAESRTTWTFDVCTNTWRRMRPAQEPLMGGCRMVYDAGADLTVAFPRGGDPTQWAYSADDNAWKQLPAADPSPTSFHALKDLAYDSASGRVFLRDSETTELWSYAVETNTWTQVDQGADVLAENPDQQSGVPHFHSLLDYDTAADRLVVTALGGSGAESGETWTFDTHLSAWTKKDAVPPGLNTGFFESGGEVAFDEARGVTVVFSDGVLATYDAVADKWTRIEPGPGWPSVDEQDGFLIGPLARLSHSLVYDPVNERILMFGGHARMPAGWKDLDDVWAFDLSTNSWIELVRARER